MLHNIRIVLVKPSHTGNIGSTARAMKNMGLMNLYLVNPLIKPDSQTFLLAASASDVISNITFVDTIDHAISGCILVVGASARTRTLTWPTLGPRECGVRIVQMSECAPVALVFGCERAGLTNDELQKCQYHVIIPANPDYNSLNLAMAVQILAYEVRVAHLYYEQRGQVHQEKIPYPLVDELERFYQQLEQILRYIGFIRYSHSGKVMSKLRRLFTRARLEESELSILRGILALIEKDNKC
ncbi:tRNA/rRNA methyltransferase [Serratia symbiotica str. 'Cinara cedri']|nr:tRNA/rRNA methyltransferase [Serratia symbiotica str. 'Cinara cedri']